MEQQKSKTERKNEKKPRFAIVLLCNIVLLLFSWIIVVQLYQKMPGYRWVYSDLLKGNMELIHKYKNLPIETRYEMKLGYTYAYLRYITQQTPDSAVILMPGERSVYFPANRKTDFTGQPYNKIWATRFLFPRKIVFEGEENNNKYANRITHVAIVNGWGYDKLNYPVENPIGNTVLPLNRK